MNRGKPLQRRTPLQPGTPLRSVRPGERVSPSRNGGAFNARGNVAFAGQMFLHGSLIPLRDADIRSPHEKAAAEGQGLLWDEDELANDCEAGVCFT